MTSQQLGLGATVAALRRRLGLNQERLAARSDLSTSTIQKLEQGKTRMLQEESLRKLAAALETTPEALVAAGMRTTNEHDEGKGERVTRHRYPGTLEEIGRDLDRMPDQAAADRIRRIVREFADGISGTSPLARMN